MRNREPSMFLRCCSNKNSTDNNSTEAAAPIQQVECWQLSLHNDMGHRLII